MKFCCKKLIIFVLVLTLVISARSQQSSIIILNPSNILREEVVEIPWPKILLTQQNIDTNNLKIVDQSGREQTYQLEYKGELVVQNLLIQVSIPPQSTRSFRLVKGKPARVKSKTYARFIPERKDDFAWENDRIAHRVYGKALENSPAELAYGIDVWVKRTDSLVINSRYKRGNYHVDHGDGLDYYHVGLTLGAGGIAPYIHDTIWYAKTFSDWKILDNGPLRSNFHLIYPSWIAAGHAVQMLKKVSIDAGSQMTKNEVVFTTDRSDTLAVVIGIIKRKEAGEMLLDEKEGLIAYWEPVQGGDGTTGIACILPRSESRMSVRDGHLLAEIVAPQNSITYYHGAAWDKAGKITSSLNWFGYLHQYIENMKRPLEITIR